MRLKTFLLYTIQILRKEIRQLLEFHTLSDHRTSLNRFVREIPLTVCYSLKIYIFALHVVASSTPGTTRSNIYVVSLFTLYNIKTRYNCKSVILSKDK